MVLKGGEVDFINNQQQGIIIGLVNIFVFQFYVYVEIKEEKLILLRVGDFSF